MLSGFLQSGDAISGVFFQHQQLILWFFRHQLGVQQCNSTLTLTELARSPQDGAPTSYANHKSWATHISD